MRKSLLLFLFVCTVVPSLNYASPGISSTDRGRIERKSKNYGSLWSQRKLRANFVYRVPVLDVMGYMAYHHASNSPDKLIQLQGALKAIAEKRDKLAKTTQIRGEKLYKEVELELTAMRNAMFQSVTDLYGAGVSASLSNYLTAKYDSSRFGLIVGRKIKF